MTDGRTLVPRVRDRPQYETHVFFSAFILLHVSSPRQNASSYIRGFLVPLESSREEVAPPTKPGTTNCTFHESARECSLEVIFLSSESFASLPFPQER